MDGMQGVPLSRALSHDDLPGLEGADEMVFTNRGASLRVAYKITVNDPLRGDSIIQAEQSA